MRVQGRHTCLLWRQSLACNSSLQAVAVTGRHLMGSTLADYAPAAHDAAGIHMQVTCTCLLWRQSLACSSSLPVSHRCTQPVAVAGPHFMGSVLAGSALTAPDTV